MQESPESDENREKESDPVEQLPETIANLRETYAELTDRQAAAALSDAQLVASRLIAEAIADGSTPAPLDLDQLDAGSRAHVFGDLRRRLPAGWTFCDVTTAHPAHPSDAGACCGATRAEPAEPPASDQLGTYAAMLDQYLRDQKHWIGPAQTPLVFHLRKIGAQLDERPDAPASLSSAYLQAFHRLDRQRPGATAPAGAAGDLPGQGSIFDELD